MAHAVDLEMAVIFVAFGFVLILLAVKLVLQRFNGFDALAVLVLGAASSAPSLGTLGTLLQTVLYGTTMAALAMAAGAGRRGVFAISTSLLFSDVMVQYRKLISGELEDIDKCAPLKLGLLVVAALFFLVMYVFYHQEDDDYRESEANSEQRDARKWFVAVLAVSSIHAFRTMRQCEEVDLADIAQLILLVRVGVLAAACVVLGENESI
jgi:succinate dehydrogenase hydrophobic anchor subunit